jgi:hypothetical protein
MYIQYTTAGKDPMKLLNSDYFQDLYITQFIFIQDTQRYLVSIFTSSVNDDYDSKLNTRMACFIVFVIVVLIAYLVLWTPFVSKLNKEVIDLCVKLLFRYGGQSRCSPLFRLKSF